MIIESQLVVLGGVVDAHVSTRIVDGSGGSEVQRFAKRFVGVLTRFEHLGFDEKGDEERTPVGRATDGVSGVPSIQEEKPRKTDPGWIIVLHLQPGSELADLVRGQ